MTIGINAAAAVKQPRTGVEEYTYQLIKHLTMLPEAGEHRFLLYIPKATQMGRGLHADDADKIPPNPPLVKGGEEGIFDFPLPENFEIKILKWPLPMWTQIRLAAEMIFNKPDALFIPVHILPMVHPKNSVVTIHGLEYEYFPQMYPWRHLQYLRWSTRYALKHARKIIAVSENTKQDLVKLYGGDENKIEVVYHGIEQKISNFPALPAGRQFPISKQIPNSKFQIPKPYILYLGRIETKKNIEGILAAYKILKEKFQIPHELILAGMPGFGYDEIKLKIVNCKLKIIETGYISEKEKWQLMKEADIFLFLSFYEGFGLPVLEAQAAGVPVITSFNSSLPEIAGQGALFVDPKNFEQIAEAVKSIIDDNALRAKLIELGYVNIKKFSWEKCARETLEILIKNESRAGA